MEKFLYIAEVILHLQNVQMSFIDLSIEQFVIYFKYRSVLHNPYIITYLNHYMMNLKSHYNTQAKKVVFNWTIQDHIPIYTSEKSNFSTSLEPNKITHHHIFSPSTQG